MIKRWDVEAVINDGCMYIVFVFENISIKTKRNEKK